jgi:hypothetical protein
MRISPRSLLRGVLVCCLAATLPAIAQNQPPNGKPGGQQGTGRPDGQKPGAGGRPGGQTPGQGNTRPAPTGKPAVRPNPGGSKPGVQPGRPNIGRPNPSRPNPGAQPSRPNPGQRPPANRPPQNRPPQGPRRPPSSHRPSHRPPQWGRPPQNRPSYNFRPDNRDYLRRYYAHRLRLINRARRPIFSVGGYFPYADITYLAALPPDVYGQLPPPPPGYQMGYYDGYVVVYDPLTYFIANVIDLLQ